MDRLAVKAIAPLIFILQICAFAPAARADTQVKAEDCSAAVSGLTIGSKVEIHCLSKEDIARVVEELVRQGVVRRAEDAGIETSVIVSLAARLRPGQKLDLAQAVVEVSNAVNIAVKVVTEGASGSSDQLVDEVLKRIAERTKANDPLGATHEAEQGFAQWEKTERERRAGASATGVALLEAALKTDLLRFDAPTAAGRVEKIVSLQHEGDPKALFEALRARRDKFYVEGEDKGVNFSLEVSIAIARREAALAQGPDQHGAALNDLGNALQTLGARESGTDTLRQAVEAYRAALEEYTRARVPLDWAMTQNNLGNALQRLGERESGTETLRQAVEAYRAALEEGTRARVPLRWAMTQNNLGAALQSLGERESGTETLQQAVEAFRAALEEGTRARVPLDWAMTQNNLGNALQRLGERESGTDTLRQAVEAFRAALEERTRARVPLRWAMTQNNLGAALQSLGKRESGTDTLRQAVEAFRAALEERTRARVPLDWAATQNNLGIALKTLGERESGTETLRQAVEAFRAALEEYARARVPLDWAMTQNNLGNALKTLGERESGTEKLRQAVAAYRAALKEFTEKAAPYWHDIAQKNLDRANFCWQSGAKSEIAQRFRAIARAPDRRMYAAW